MANSLPIKCRIEEIPAILGFTKDTYLRDKVLLEGYKPLRYVAGYGTSIDTLKTNVEGIVNPKQLTAELKVITLRIFTNMIALRPKLDRLEGYLNDAVGLSVSKEDFGISPVRKKISSDDQEGLNGALLYLLGNLNAANMAILTPLGFLPADRTAIDDLRKSIADDNTAQNTKISARANLVVANFSVLVDACNFIKAQWADGKALFKNTDKTKLKDYTNAQIINRVRQEALKTKIVGVVQRASVPEKGAKVVAKPVLGGRGKTVKTNVNGEYELSGLREGSYNVTITAVDGKQALVQADAVTGVSVTAPVAQIT